AADATVLKPTLELYELALKNGLSIFFVSGRSQSELEATQKNLLKAGYKNWTQMYLKPESYHLQSIIPFKSHARALIEQQGYIILASIGDQYSDFQGGFTKKGFKL